MKKIILVLISIIFIQSCVVSKKKYDDLSMKKSRLESEKSVCEDSLNLTKAERDRLKNELDILGPKFNNLIKDYNTITKDTADQNQKFRKLDKDYEELSNTFEKLYNKHRKLETFSANEAERMTKDLLERERELLIAKKIQDTLAMSLKAREARVKELESILAEKDKAVENLKNIVSKALLNFKENDLSVTVKNGKVYVSLSEQLLFKSGSTVIDKKGVDALKTIGNILKDEKDITIMVEGHTDDVPLNKGIPNMQDNWDLSVLRATSITRILLTEGIDPTKIVPAGRGEFLPIDPAKTKEARQSNRRTEIILTPKLDELFKVLENN